MCRHMLEKMHSIDWKNASYVSNNKNIDVIQIIASAFISKLPTFNFSSGFYAFVDNIAQDII